MAMLWVCCQVILEIFGDRLEEPGWYEPIVEPFVRPWHIRQVERPVILDRVRRVDIGLLGRQPEMLGHSRRNRYCLLVAPRCDVSDWQIGHADNDTAA